MSKETLEFLIGIAIAVFITTFVVGMFEQFDRIGNYTPCEYESVAGFAPGRVVACELFRKRWGK